MLAPRRLESSWAVKLDPLRQVVIIRIHRGSNGKAGRMYLYFSSTKNVFIRFTNSTSTDNWLSSVAEEDTDDILSSAVDDDNCGNSVSSEFKFTITFALCDLLLLGLLLILMT